MSPDIAFLDLLELIFGHYEKLMVINGTLYIFSSVHMVPTALYTPRHQGPSQG